MKNILFIIVVLFIAFNSGYSQFLSGKNAQILVKGIIKDENTNIPVGVSIELKDPEGKKIKTQSDIKTGVFEQLLPPATKYTVTLIGDEILRKEFTFETEQSEQYKEQKTEWSVVKPVAGVKLFSGEIFNKNAESISDEGNQNLKDLQLLLRFNRTLYVSFEVGGESTLIDKRISVLNKFLDTWTREKSRIEVKPYKKDSQNKNLYVFITKTEEFLTK